MRSLPRPDHSRAGARRKPRLTPAEALLAWYDAAARELPWRVPPAARRAGARPDPYRVWLSEVMLQQTTVAAAGPYFARFTAAWPDAAALAAAEDDAVMAAWAGLGYYARARNLLKCARQVAGPLGGRFPQDEAALRALPGIGPYTAAAIAAIAFDRPAVVVDGNVERVMARRFAITAALPGAKAELRERAASLTPRQRPGDYAQAVMDLGATICTPTRPACGACPWTADCEARARGIAAELPAKAPKKAKPLRRGAAFVALTKDGAVLLERRPERGLLGGMMGLPGTEWAEDAPGAHDIAAAAPFPAAWRRAPAQARHTFTHFHLVLDIMTTTTGVEARPARGAYVPQARAQAGNLPTVMRKALLIGLAALEGDGG